MITYLLAYSLAAMCPTIQKTTVEGATWTKADDAAIEVAEAKCKEMGFECAVHIKKYDEYNFSVDCGFGKEEFREGGRQQ